MVCALVVLTGCTTVDAPTQASIRLPPAGGAPDYQLGGAYEPSPAVEIVVRDREADPADDRYTICYINAFQTQPGESDAWPAEVLLRDADGQEVRDPDWPDEILLDTSTPTKRTAIADELRPWIEGCADDGFDAVEFDNLDSASRSRGALDDADNAALAETLVGIAHDAGLAAAQKNAAESSATLREQADFDFAIAEECAARNECAAYTDVYGDLVIDVEYLDASSQPFGDACADAATPRSVVLRDRALSTPDSADFVFALC